jgi:dienelactone hydrolase
MKLAGFDNFAFSHEDTGLGPYRRGKGPGIVVIHEIPGITLPVAEFALRVADQRFTVSLPHLFGEPGKALSPPPLRGQLARACISRESHLLKKRGSSPITDWLRALCRHAHACRSVFESRLQETRA